MSESTVVEIYELQKWKSPWVLKNNMEPCSPPDEFVIPSGDWSWASNWRIDKKPGTTDSDGWEYASKMVRFMDISSNKDRRARAEKSWNDTARRRLWLRIMRREVGIVIRNAADVNKTLPKVQSGLTSVHAARQRIEEIMLAAPEAANSDQMKALVQSVKKNISDIRSLLESMEKQVQSGQGAVATAPAMIKKLRNEITKEELAIDRALYPHQAAKDRAKSFFPLKKASSLGNEFDKPAAAPTTKRENYADGSSSSGRGGDGSFSAKEKGIHGVTRSFSGMPVSSNSAGGGSDDTVEKLMLLGPKSASIKGGSAKVFKPTLSGSFRFKQGTAEDGLFLDRTTQDAMIEQKLVAVDEVTVMQEIIEERGIHKGLSEIKEMFVDLSRLVKEQETEIDSIFHNVDESNERTRTAFQHIVEAQRLQQSGNCAIS
eukprot:gene24679-33150_t